MPRNWQAVVDQLADVQKLVHLAMRRDDLDVDQWRASLLRQMRRAYEEELAAMAARVGCPGRTARLENGPLLSALNEQAGAWAANVCNTYNYDLALAVQAIAEQTPTANRNTYAKRIQEWDEGRKQWKDQQIAAYTDGWTRAQAQSDFRRMNGTLGTAELVPQDAVCPVCLGIIARGKIPLREAMRNPPPFHLGCPHYWDIQAEQAARDDCPLLWMGE
jgi:hypothetical protein